MAEFSNLVLTGKGKEMVANIIGGEELTFSRMVTTDVTYGIGDLPALESIPAVQTQMVGNIKKISADTVSMLGIFSNQDLTEGYYLRAVGLYALAGGVECLYGVAIETSNNCFMPAYKGTTLSKMTLQINTIVGDAEKVQIQLKDGTYALAEDLEDVQKAVDILKQKGNVTVIFTDATERENIESGESLPSILGKVKRFFAELKTVAFTGSYRDLSDKPTIPTMPDIPDSLKNPHSIKINGKTYDGSSNQDVGTMGIAYGGTGATDASGARTNLGIAASGHKHAAADVTSGTMSIARGGTGATTTVAARTNLELRSAAICGVANNLTTTESWYLLDARQGKALKDNVDQINSDLTTLTTNGTVTKFTPQADGLYATYKVGADTVTKKLGSPVITSDMVITGWQAVSGYNTVGTYTASVKMPAGYTRAILTAFTCFESNTNAIYDVVGAQSFTMLKHDNYNYGTMHNGIKVFDVTAAEAATLSVSAYNAVNNIMIILVLVPIL